MENKPAKIIKSVVETVRPVRSKKEKTQKDEPRERYDISSTLSAIVDSGLDTFANWAEGNRDDPNRQVSLSARDHGVQFSLIRHDGAKVLEWRDNTGTSIYRCRGKEVLKSIRNDDGLETPNGIVTDKTELHRIQAQLGYFTADLYAAD